MLSGPLRKMHTESCRDVQYHLPVGEESLALNPLIGKPFALTYLGDMHCIHCDRAIKKSFQQGYCYPCYRELLSCDLCMIHPVRCHSQHGPCDESHWAHANCNKPHIVYLANSSGLKVGITRNSQIPTRWIDQGAVQALPIFQVSNRYQSGVIEAALSEFVNDKTNWRAMLKGVPPVIDLVQARDELLNQAASQLESVLQTFDNEAIMPYPDAAPVEIVYPVERYPETIKSLNFDKMPEINGTLLGIKGQYLILDSGVINIRKFGGYNIEVPI